MRQQIFYGFHKPRAPKLQNPGGKQDQVDSSWIMCPCYVAGIKAPSMQAPRTAAPFTRMQQTYVVGIIC